MRCVQLLVFLSITACGATETATNAVPSPTPTPEATPTPTPTPEPLLDSVELVSDLPICSSGGAYDGHEVKIEKPAQRKKCQDGVWVITVPPEPVEELTADEVIKRLRTIKLGDTLQTMLPEAREILLIKEATLTDLAASTDTCTPQVAGQEYRAVDVVKYGLPLFSFWVEMRGDTVEHMHIEVGETDYSATRLCGDR